jgi:predicted nicotinamide N-methyase
VPLQHPPASDQAGSAAAGTGLWDDAFVKTRPSASAGGGLDRTRGPLTRVRGGPAGRSVDPRTLVKRLTSLVPVPGAEWIRLHLANDAMSVWHATREASGDPDEPIPFWGMAWGGGLAIARYLRDHPDIAAGRRVLDLGSGSGLCAIAASLAGARSVTAVEIDRYALAAIALNARANRRRLEILAMDVLAEEPPAVDLVLAGDCWYELPMASRASAWLRAASERGIDVLMGDPGRRHLDIAGLRELAVYDVRTTSDLEDLGRTRAWVRSFATSEG